jgi:hypothetical protein
MEWASSWTEIRKIYVNFLVHIIGDLANDANILGRSVHIIKKNTEALVIASKETVLEINDEKTKYMVISWDQNAGRSHDIKIDNSCFERVEQFRYLGITLKNQNSIQEENKCRLKSQIACYHSVQNTIYITAHLNVLLTAGCTQCHFLRRSFLSLSRRTHAHVLSVKSILYWKKKVASTSNCFVPVRARSQQLFDHRNNLVASPRLA